MGYVVVSDIPIKSVNYTVDSEPSNWAYYSEKVYIRIKNRIYCVTDITSVYGSIYYGYVSLNQNNIGV